MDKATKIKIIKQILRDAGSDFGGTRPYLGISDTRNGMNWGFGKHISDYAPNEIILPLRLHEDNLKNFKIFYQRINETLNYAAYKAGYDPYDHGYNAISVRPQHVHVNLDAIPDLMWTELEWIAKGGTYRYIDPVTDLENQKLGRDALENMMKMDLTEQEKFLKNQPSNLLSFIEKPLNEKIEHINNKSKDKSELPTLLKIKGLIQTALKEAQEKNSKELANLQLAKDVFQEMINLKSTTQQKEFLKTQSADLQTMIKDLERWHIPSEEEKKRLLDNDTLEAKAAFENMLKLNSTTKRKVFFDAQFSHLQPIINEFQNRHIPSEGEKNILLANDTVEAKEAFESMLKLNSTTKRKAFFDAQPPHLQSIIKNLQDWYSTSEESVQIAKNEAEYRQSAKDAAENLATVALKNLVTMTVKEQTIFLKKQHPRLLPVIKNLLAENINNSSSEQKIALKELYRPIEMIIDTLEYNSNKLKNLNNGIVANSIKSAKTVKTEQEKATSPVDNPGSSQSPTKATEDKIGPYSLQPPTEEKAVETGPQTNLEADLDSSKSNAEKAEEKAEEKYVDFSSHRGPS